MYSDQALSALKLIIQRYGAEIGQDARRVEALLKDWCPEAKKEINVLAFAARDNVPEELVNTKGLPIGVLITRASARLKEHSGFKPSLCTWAVEAWARALGLIRTEDMTEQVDCPGCAVQIRVSVRARGKLLRCPKCGIQFSWKSDGTIESFVQTSAEQKAPTERAAGSVASARDPSPTAQYASPSVRRPQPVSSLPVGEDLISQAPNSTWYVRPASGGQHGPVRGEIMWEWVRCGWVSGDSLVWREDFSDWKSAGELFPSLAGTGTAATRAAGSPRQTSDDVFLFRLRQLYADGSFTPERSSWVLEWQEELAIPREKAERLFDQVAAEVNQLKTSLGLWQQPTAANTSATSQTNLASSPIRPAGPPPVPQMTGSLTLAKSYGGGSSLSELTYVRGKVSGPALGLMSVGVLAVALAIISLAVVATSTNRSDDRDITVVMGLIGVFAGAFVAYGGLALSERRHVAIVIAATIAACVLPHCCFVGVPVAIWSWAVLADPRVFNSFR